MKPVFIHYHSGTQKYIVTMVSEYDWKQTHTGWMADPLIGKFGNIPSIDVVAEQFEFDDEQAALTKVAQLYSEQLK